MIESKRNEKYKSRIAGYYSKKSAILEGDKAKFGLLKGSFLLAASSDLAIMAYGFVNFTKLSKIELFCVIGAFLVVFCCATILLRMCLVEIERITKGGEDGRRTYDKCDSGV